MSKIQAELTVCDALFEFAENLFSQDSRINEFLEMNAIYEVIKEVTTYVNNSSGSNLLLALKEAEKSHEKNDNYSHAVRTTIYSIVIGKYTKLARHKLIELGVSALLHDVGKILLPQKIIDNPTPPTEEELATLNKHPLLGYKLLDICNFPPGIREAVSEHHEREDGTGFPQQLTGDKISPYGKVLGLACSYESITTGRKKQEALDPHSGILSILKNKKKYDNNIVMALVNSLSIFPIGMFVLLSDGTKGKVVDTDQLDPRYPIVQLLEKKTFEGKEIIRHTFSGGLQVVRPLRKDEYKEFM